MDSGGVAVISPTTGNNIISSPSHLLSPLLKSRTQASKKNKMSKQKRFCSRCNIAVCPLHMINLSNTVSCELYLTFFGIFIFQMHGFLVSNIFSNMKNSIWKKHKNKKINENCNTIE